ncbi:MAG: hypothetical protein HQM10_07355 [Candidatus Riflebacteria bacterium]|nr:hypothetical protein [Candidatus Riflebacteria bacterium]
MKFGNHIFKLIFIFSYCLLCSQSLFAGEVKFEIVRLLKKVDSKYLKTPGEEISQGRSERYLSETFQCSSKDEVEKLLKEWSGGELDNAQKKIVEMVGYGKDKLTTDLMTLGKKNKGKDDRDIIVKIYDSSLVENELGKKFFMKEFWPSSSGDTIKFPIAYVSSVGGNPSKILVHELSHAIDNNRRESGSYGPDGDHSPSEITMPRSAFVEGWAEYNTLYAFPGKDGDASKGFETVLNAGVRIESSKGKYDKYSAEKVTGEEILSTEGVNALILHKISAEFGRKKLEKAFLDSNSKKTTIGDFLSSFVKLYPDSLKKVFNILNKETFGILSDSKITEILGDGKTVETFLKNRKQPAFSRNASEKILVSISEDRNTIKTIMEKPQPISDSDKDTLQKAKEQLAKKMADYETCVSGIIELMQNKEALKEYSPSRDAELRSYEVSASGNIKKQKKFMDSVDNFLLENEKNNLPISKIDVDDSNINTTQPEGQEQPVEGTSEKGLFGN